VTPSALRIRLAEIASDPLDRLAGAGDDIMETLDQTVDRVPVPAAVLVPVVMSDAPTVLLTKRTSHLSAHAGQVCLPGGRIDPEDSGPEAAALREAWEEIGLEASSVHVLGRMADVITGTGYRITPVLALLPPGLSLRLSADEVEAVFELPMSVILDPNAPKLQRQHVGGVWREYWVWPHPSHYIWGATAKILVRLAEQLRERSA
jgi:8-oxo-dGTP pyrophosphatase MutT (NUDIX family)